MRGELTIASCVLRIRRAAWAACVVALLVAAVAQFAGCSGRTRAERMKPTLAVAAEPVAVVNAAPATSPAPSADGAAGGVSDAARSTESMRRPIAVATPMPPAGAGLKTALARVSRVLSEGDVQQARELAMRAAVDFPSSVEPLELALVCALRGNDAKSAAELVERIGVLEPSSPLVLGFRGLRAAGAGEWEEALGWLSWFVGEGSVTRSGRIVALPADPGEIEEQAGFAALRLGRFSAAERLLALASEAVRGQPLRRRLVEALRADALRAQGRTAEARVLLRADASEPTPGDALAVLEALRLDQLLRDEGEAGRVLDDAVSSVLSEPSNDAWLWRVVRAADAADGIARFRAISRLEGARAVLGPFRHALVMAALDPPRRTQVLDDAWLDVSDLGQPVDRVALTLSLRHVSLHARQRLVPLASFVAEWRPNDLDAVAFALLASGAGPDDLMAELEARADAAARALRSRILARFGFPEEAQRLVAEARSVRPTSKVLRVAAALSAIDLLDAGLLGSVDEVARRDDGSTDRTMALAWYALQEMHTARERAAAAVKFDARDRAARLCLALASLEVPGSRVVAAEDVRELAAGADLIGGEAWGMRRAVVSALDPDAAKRFGESWPACRDVVAELRSLAAECEVLRIPLAAECLGLVEQIDPMQRVLVQIVRLPLAQRAPRMDDWCAQLASEAPALPDRRQLAAVGRVPGAGTIPDGPFSARADWLAAASREMVRAYREQAIALRPDGAEKLSILLIGELEAGRIDAAVARLRELAQAGDARLSTLAARRTLAGLSRIAQSEDSPGEELAELLEKLVGKMDRLSPADLAEAIALLEVSTPTASEVTDFATELARRSRPILASESGTAIEALGSLVRRSGDPFAASVLAGALAIEQRSAQEVRRKLSTAAVGLAIGAGLDVDEVSAIVGRLVAAGAVPFEDEGEAQPVSEQWRLARARMRTAELFGLLGRSADSRALLVSALELAPDDAQILNGLAYADLEAGTITDATVARAEQAATARPDDPAILDTLGFLRYHQGRFGDDAEGLGAVSLFRQALRIRPNSPSLVTLDHLGDAQWRAGDQQGAIKSWQQVDEVARLRYPPELFRVRMSSFQLERFGFELVPVAQFVRREYGAVVERAEAKLGQVARGEPPAVADCQATR